MMSILKSFVETTTAGLIASFVSVGVDSSIEALASVSPLTGLLVTILGIIIVARNLEDIYDAGAVGIATIPAFAFQFMPLAWVVGIYVGIVVGAALFERLFDAVSSWFK